MPTRKKEILYFCIDECDSYHPGGEVVLLKFDDGEVWVEGSDRALGKEEVEEAIEWLQNRLKDMSL